MLPVFILTSLLVQSCVSGGTVRATPDFAGGRYPVSSIAVLKPEGDIRYISRGGLPRNTGIFSLRISEMASSVLVKELNKKGYSASRPGEHQDKRIQEKQLSGGISAAWHLVSGTLYDRLYQPKERALNIDATIPAEALQSPLLKDSDMVLYISYSGASYAGEWDNATLSGGTIIGTGNVITPTGSRHSVQTLAVLINSKTGAVLWANQADKDMHFGNDNDFIAAIVEVLDDLPARGQPIAP